MHKKTKVFVDLDDTLLNTAQIKRDMFSKIAQMGVPLAEVEDNYRQAREQFGGDYLKPFAESFQEFGIDAGILYSGLRQMVMENSESYLIEDRLLWLDQFQNDKYELYLLTYGNPDIQEVKVQGLHLENLFEGGVVYVKGSKIDEIKKLISSEEKFILIDDKREILDEVINEFPEQAKVFQAKKNIDEEGHEEYDDPEGYYSPLDMREGGRY